MSLQQLEVVREERRAGVVLHVDQRVLDEQLARGLRVYLLVGHAAARRQQEPEQRHAFVDRGARGAAFPVRLVVLALHQVRAGLLDPRGLDARDIARVDLRGLDLLGAHDPRGPRLELARTRVDEELRAVGAEILALLATVRDLRQEPGEQRAVDRRVLSRLRIELQRELALHHLHHLAMHVVPFGEPQIGEEVLLAPAAQLGARELLALLLVFAPQLQQRQEIRLLVAQRRVLLVGLGLLVRRPIARIRHRKRRGDDRDFFEAVLGGRREQHAAETRVER